MRFFGPSNFLLFRLVRVRNILDHFSGRFRAIRRSWSFGDNLDAFNKAIRNGKSATDATFETWTGQQAAEHGYTHAVVRNLEGSPGNYAKVNITFMRP